MISYKPLLDLIDKKGISLNRLSIDIGLQPTSLANSVNKGKNIYVSTIVLICNYLKCSIEDVICYKSTDTKEIKQFYQPDWEKIQSLGSLRSISLSVNKGQNWLFNMKRNNACISNYDLQKIADKYNCSIDELGTLIQSDSKN